MNPPSPAPEAGLLLAALARLITGLAGRAADGPRGSGIAVSAGPGLILSPGSIPTTEVYFPASVCSDWRFVDTLTVQPEDVVLDSREPVIIVRHAPTPWLKWLVRNHRLTGRLALFIDDDMPAALDDADLPLIYALKTSWRFHTSFDRLRSAGAALWVSTPALAERYAADCLLPPCFVEPGVDSPGDSLRYFYHGTGAHRREIEWLVPIVREVQARVPAARFEIAGDARTASLYRGIPGVSVRAPTPWPVYRELPRQQRFGLGLSPCLEGRFNSARSHVKFFDITRFGAAGIYSDRAPYADVITPGLNGWLCADRQEDWVNAILAALNDAPRLAAVHAAALGACRALSRREFPA